MKIGYLLEGDEEIRQPPFNGPANHIRQIFREMSQRGHQVTILFRLGGKIWKSEDLVEFLPLTVSKIDQGWLRWIERIVRRIQFQLKLPYIGFFESLRFALACRQEISGYDVYYERFSWMTFGGALASRWQNIPLVLEYNGNPLSDLDAKGISPRGFQRWLSVRIMRWAVRQADHVVATGDGWRKSCVNDWGVPAKITTTVENGTDLIKVLRREDVRSFRIDNEDKSCLRLVYLGGFYPWHGIDILLRAVSRLVEQGVCLHLTLIGAGDGYDTVKRLASDLNLDQVVNFKGRLASDEYAPILADSDVGLSPYCGWEEFSGLKIFDYKAAGLACIASGRDGQPSTLKHNETGWIVPPCDEDALVAAIHQLASEPEKRRRLGQAARLEAERMHSWTHTAIRIETIIRELVPG